VCTVFTPPLIHTRWWFSQRDAPHSGVHEGPDAIIAAESEGLGDGRYLQRSNSPLRTSTLAHKHTRGDGVGDISKRLWCFLLRVEMVTLAFELDFVRWDGTETSIPPYELYSHLPVGAPRPAI
jgi:hypothetical protein